MKKQGPSLLERVEHELKHDIAVMIKESEIRAKEESDKKAKEILVTSNPTMCS